MTRIRFTAAERGRRPARSKAPGRGWADRPTPPGPYRAAGISGKLSANKNRFMKAFAKTLVTLALSGLVLALLASVSVWLVAAFLLIFAADIIAIVAADFKRTQRRRIVNSLSAVASRTSAALRFGA
jgi:hypothetical protein